VRFSSIVIPLFSAIEIDCDIFVSTSVFTNVEFCDAVSRPNFSVEDFPSRRSVVEFEEGLEANIDVAVKMTRTTFEPGEWATSKDDCGGESLCRLGQLMERGRVAGKERRTSKLAIRTFQAAWELQSTRQDLPARSRVESASRSQAL
jgi:hypothetical protein